MNGNMERKLVEEIATELGLLHNSQEIHERRLFGLKWDMSKVVPQSIKVKCFDYPDNQLHGCISDPRFSAEDLDGKVLLVHGNHFFFPKTLYINGRELEIVAGLFNATKVRAFLVNDDGSLKLLSPVKEVSEPVTIEQEKKTFLANIFTGSALRRHYDSFSIKYSYNQLLPLSLVEFKYVFYRETGRRVNNPFSLKLDPIIDLCVNSEVSQILYLIRTLQVLRELYPHTKLSDNEDLVAIVTLLEDTVSEEHSNAMISSAINFLTGCAAQRLPPLSQIIVKLVESLKLPPFSFMLDIDPMTLRSSIFTAERILQAIPREDEELIVFSCERQPSISLTLNGIKYELTAIIEPYGGLTMFYHVNDETLTVVHYGSKGMQPEVVSLARRQFALISNSQGLALYHKTGIRSTSRREIP